MLMRYKESSEINVADVEPGFEKSMDFQLKTIVLIQLANIK